MIMPRVTMIAHIKDTGTTGKEGRRPRKSGNPGTGPLYAIRMWYIEEKSKTRDKVSFTRKRVNRGVRVTERGKVLYL